MTERRQLQLRFHGRVIDHLGIQMYQSPVAAVAEMVANAWDADASEVAVEIPTELGPDAKFVVRDNGLGMTFEECQDRFLHVGYNRRLADNASHSPSGRPLLGRKGIGKFAGFGIADLMTIDTVSAATGEHTRFRLDLNRLRGESDEYIEQEPTAVPGVAYKGPAESRRGEHGTSVVLQALSLRRTPALEQFRRSMARRFLLLERASDFDLAVNGAPLGEYEDVESFQYVFPRDYEESERPEQLVDVGDGWGEEILSNGQRIRWRIGFYPDTIKEDEFRGIAVFAHGKIAQAPFLFELSGGTGEQAGQQYLSGGVEADFLDELDEDLIATERQRVDWTHPESTPLLDWGQTRVRQLLRMWGRRRREERVRAIDERIAPFAQRLERFSPTERRIVRGALVDLAGIDSLTDEQFQSLGSAVVASWEGGRLKELITTLGHAGEMSEPDLAEILTEQRVLTAVHLAEAAKTRTMLIDGLRNRLGAGDLEAAVRTYVAENPWLVSPKWETFEPEDDLVTNSEASNENLDLVLRSGNDWLILEFRALGQPASDEDVRRFSSQVARLVEREISQRASNGTQTTNALLIADRDESSGDAESGIEILTWQELLERASIQWRDFLQVLSRRAPDDERLASLADPGPT